MNAAVHERPATGTDSLTSSWMAAARSMDGDRRGIAEARAFMERSTAVSHGQTVPCSAVPRLFDAAAKSIMQHACETMHAILEKVIAHYCADPGFRALFRFEPRAERLVVDSYQAKTSLPFARYDIFLDEQTGAFSFCELNADGSSGMNEDREIAAAMRKTGAFARFAQTRRLEENELVESWIDTFVDLAGLAALDAPSVVICDYLEVATLSEFEVYRRRFERRGIACEICDVRNLVMANGSLCLPGGRRVDAVWRRCVASDLLAHWDESSALIEAMRAGSPCVLGDFSGIIAHDKRIFRILHLPQTQGILSESEQAFIAAHVPFTALLDSAHVDLHRIKEEKDHWVVKPADGYGAHDVYLGIDCTADGWSSIIDACADEAAGRPFVAQRFQTPFRTPAVPLCTDTGEDAAPRQYANLSGLYAYGGHFAGTFSRLGPRHIVSGRLEGLTAATFWVDCDRPDPRR